MILTFIEAYRCNYVRTYCGPIILLLLFEGKLFEHEFLFFSVSSFLCLNATKEPRGLRSARVEAKTIRAWSKLLFTFKLTKFRTNMLLYPVVLVTIGLFNRETGRSVIG
jgi:hypothetical protein